MTWRTDGLWLCVLVSVTITAPHPLLGRQAAEGQGAARAGTSPPTSWCCCPNRCGTLYGDSRTTDRLTATISMCLPGRGARGERPGQEAEGSDRGRAG